MRFTGPFRHRFCWVFALNASNWSLSSGIVGQQLRNIRTNPLQSPPEGTCLNHQAFTKAAASDITVDTFDKRVSTDSGDESDKEKKMRDFLGLDLGTHCGWARGQKAQGKVAYTHGTFDLSVTRFDSPSLRGVKLKRAIEPLLIAGVEIVYFEQVMRHKGVAAAHVYGGLLSAMQEICEQYDVPVEGLHVGTIKKFATKKGNASKTAMVDAAIRAGHTVQTEDEADAIWVLRCGMSRDTP